MSNGGMHPHPEALYYHIAVDALQSAKTEKDEFRRKQCVTTALVFAALCLESFINQEYFSHSETAKVLQENDRFPIESKWLMLPLLLGSNQTFDKGKHPYSIFQELVSTRNNRLVHFKPNKEKVISSEKFGKEYFGELAGNVNLAKKYVKYVGDMIVELNRLTHGKTNVPLFFEGQKYMSRVWSSATSLNENI